MRARQLQPPLDAPRDSAGLVVLEVDAEFFFEHAVHGRHAPRVDARFGVLVGGAAQVFEQKTRHFCGRQHRVGHARVARCLGHAVELCAVGILHHD